MLRKTHTYMLIRLHHWTHWLVAGMLALGLTVVVLLGMHPDPAAMRGLVFERRKKETLWKTIEATQVESGATVPADTNVIFRLPPDMGRITREVLLGMHGKDTRYWGYCYPDESDASQYESIIGFPGKLFLSEAERAARIAQKMKLMPRFSIFRPPTTDELERAADPEGLHGVIRHQVEIFKGGQTCYIMTAKPLSIGSDIDHDGVNAALERIFGTDPQNSDTDGDGLTDGIELFTSHTDPLRRDTDGDGLIEGIEDANRNGIVDPGETNPLIPDSDHDGLCDGYCRLRAGMRICGDDSQFQCVNTSQSNWAGEDRNLNGIVDTGETDPRMWSTLRDGLSDLQRYYKCLLARNTNC